MIFSIGNHVQQIVNGEKTQTRRLVKGLKPPRYIPLFDYAVQPCRTCKGITEGRIQILALGVEHRGEIISEKDAKAEGGYTPEEFEVLFEKMYPEWKHRWVYCFRFIPSSRGKMNE